MEDFKNFALHFGLTGVFNTKTTSEWSLSDYKPKLGELLFSIDQTDPEDPMTWMIRAKIGIGCGRTWNETPYWNVGQVNPNYRPVTILRQSDFTGSDYINTDWAGLNHYQVIYQGVRLTNEITKNLSGGFTLNDGFNIYENELMVIF